MTKTILVNKTNRQLNLFQLLEILITTQKPMPKLYWLKFSSSKFWGRIFFSFRLKTYENWKKFVFKYKFNQISYILPKFHQKVV
jgi:hypothetical protein